MGHPGIRERPEEGGHGLDPFPIAVELRKHFDVGIPLEAIGPVPIGEITAAGIKLHHLLERQLAAVVEVRAGEIDVAQGRHLERSLHRQSLAGFGICAGRDREAAGIEGRPNLVDVRGDPGGLRREGEGMAEGIGAADADILARRPNVDVVEAGVVDRLSVAHPHPLDELVFRDAALAGELLEGADRSPGELWP